MELVCALSQPTIPCLAGSPLRRWSPRFARKRTSSQTPQDAVELAAALPRSTTLSRAAALKPLRRAVRWHASVSTKSKSRRAQAQCNSWSVGLRHVLNASRQRHQNSDHGGTSAINARRCSASRRQWSRLSMILLTEAERNSSVLRASRSIARNCSTSTRNTFISMSKSFSSRRITGSGSGASHAGTPENGIAK